MARESIPVLAKLPLLSLLILTISFPAPRAFTEDCAIDDRRWDLKAVNNLTWCTISRTPDCWTGHPGKAAGVVTEKTGNTVADICVEGEPGVAHQGAASTFDSAKLSKGARRLKEAAGRGGETSDTAYKEAMKKEREAYEMAMDTLTEEAKATYEVAKERMSQATGDLGAQMLRRAVMGSEE